MPQTLLEARHVTKHFPLRMGMLRRTVGLIHAVDEVDLAIAPGRSVGLVGESGCGKSTLARLLVGLLQPTAGEVLFNDVPLGQLRGSTLQALHQKVQLVFQDPTNSLNPRMRVEEIVAEPLVIHRLANGRTLDRRINELLETMQLSSRLRDRRPNNLSTGERQRVGLARALATNPQLLICDEPIASLDVSVGAQILELLNSLKHTQHLALVFISHDLGAVSFLCDVIAVMYLGRLVEVAPTTQLLTSPWHPYTELLLQSSSLDLGTRPAGERPSSVQLPSGCRFRTRCPLAAPVCADEDPPLVEKAPGRLVACHFRP